MSDLIKREDAIKAVAIAVLDDRDELEAIKALPSAEDEPSLKAIKRQIEEHWYLDPPSAEAVQIPIKLEKRYPESKDEDITDAFMRGYLAGRSSAEAVGEWVKEIHHHKDDEQEFDYYDIHCSVCGAKPQKSWALTNYCPYCGAKMTKGDDTTGESL